jgi:histidinol dehydrogenase
MKIDNWQILSAQEKLAVLARPQLATSENQLEEVRQIIASVREKGDRALIDYANFFDKAPINHLKVTASEFESAKKEVASQTLDAIAFAVQQIKAYHLAQMPSKMKVESSEGIICEREMRAIENVGLYIPGGSAPLVSTVLMLAIPAELAGCTNRILVTPPNSEGKINANILVAAMLCNVTAVYKAGGAQAIAALAYGTESISKVDKIFGPGNSWVTRAKRLVAGDINANVSIDMPAGPSEVLVIADDKASPAFVAADLLSQAEHGPDSQVILIAASSHFIEKVWLELKQQMQRAPRKAIIEQSLKHARFILASGIDEAMAISNQYAPEHLILNVDNSKQYKAQIQHAGAVFLGAFTPETMGDYINGSNHVLPTAGYAKSMSGLSVLDFCKFISFQEVSAEALKNSGMYARELAQVEGLFAHDYAIDVRLKTLFGEKHE